MIYDVVELPQFGDCLYSVKDNNGVAYITTFRKLLDPDYLVGFFDRYKHFLQSDHWKEVGYDRLTSEELAQVVVDEAKELRQILKTHADNVAAGKRPDLDDYFKPLNGKYKFCYELEVDKGYGPASSSLIRIYAIRLASNCYIFVCGGIKLTKKIQQSPDLKERVIAEIDDTMKFLRQNGITEPDDV